MGQVKRLFFWNSGVYFRREFAETDFINKYFENEEWHCKDETVAFIKLSPYFWNWTDIRYDGHTVKSVTVLGVEIGQYYSYDSRPKSKWSAEEEHKWRQCQD